MTPVEDRIARVLLIVGGGYHDFDMVRRELLGLLGEDERIRTTCTNDWHDIDALGRADMVIAYTTNVFPDDAGRAALEQFLDRGGKWLAIHGASAYIEFKGPEIDVGGIKLPGLTDTPDKQPEYMDLLGCRFVSHLAQQPIVVESVSDHPIVKGLPPFEVVDEPYIVELRGECEVLLTSRYTGEAPGYVAGPWLENLPRPQALLHRHGKGEALFLAPGHSIGAYDLRPFISKLPSNPGPWNDVTYREVLRRAIRWGTALPALEAALTTA